MWIGKLCGEGNMWVEAERIFQEVDKYEILCKAWERMVKHSGLRGGVSII